MSRPPVPPEVVAAIAAAVDAVWPRPVILTNDRAVRLADAYEPPAWRFSGRSWGTHVASRRDRP